MAGRSSPTHLVVALVLAGLLIFFFRSRGTSEENPRLKQRDQASQTPKEDSYHWKTTNSQKGIALIASVCPCIIEIDINHQREQVLHEITECLTSCVDSTEDDEYALRKNDEAVQDPDQGGNDAKDAVDDEGDDGDKEDAETAKGNEGENADKEDTETAGENEGEHADKKDAGTEEGNEDGNADTKDAETAGNYESENADKKDAGTAQVNEGGNADTKDAETAGGNEGENADTKVGGSAQDQQQQSAQVKNEGLRIAPEPNTKVIEQQVPGPVNRMQQHLPNADAFPSNVEDRNKVVSNARSNLRARPANLGDINQVIPNAKPIVKAYNSNLHDRHRLVPNGGAAEGQRR